MKRFILKITPFVCFCFFLIVFLPIFIDPYNVFHAKNMRSNSVEQNRNYVKMTYLLDNPDKFESYIFGSSRVGVIHTEKITDEHCYNMTYSMGVPAETLNNVKTMLANGVTVKKIYVGLDELSYMEAPGEHYTQPIRMPYEYAHEHPVEFLKTYLNPTMAVESLENTLAQGFGLHEDMSIFYDYGWWGYYRMETLEPFEPSLQGPIREYGKPELYAAAMQTLRELTDLCAENEIQLVFFTNPVFAEKYCEIVTANDYLGFLRSLAELAPFVNFTGINNVTLDSTNYLDAGHYSAEVGDLVRDCLTGMEPDAALYTQGFGWTVDKNNIDEFLTLLESQPLT